jgi:hypothetical protein
MSETLNLPAWDELGLPENIDCDWVTMDWNGPWYGYRKKPKCNHAESRWISVDGHWVALHSISSFKPPQIPADRWMDSAISRSGIESQAEARQECDTPRPEHQERGIVPRPAGVTPRNAHDRIRMAELLAAFERYREANIAVNPKWIDEYRELNARMPKPEGEK